MGLIREPGKVTIITNYVFGSNLFELVHAPEKKVYDLYTKCNNTSRDKNFYCNHLGHIFIWRKVEYLCSDLPGIGLHA